MAEPGDVGSLRESLARELLQDEAVLSLAERELLGNVLQRGLSVASGDPQLDAAVAERLITAAAESLGARILNVLAREILAQLVELRPVGPGIDPFPPIGPGRVPAAPGRPIDPGVGPFPSLGPVRIPGAPGRPAPGFQPWIGPIRTPSGPNVITQVSPSNPGNPPGGQVSPSNPGNPPGGQVSPSNPGNVAGGQVSPSNPGNPPGGQVSPSNPGNPPGGQVSPSNPGNPPGGFGLPSLGARAAPLGGGARVPGIGTPLASKKQDKAGKPKKRK